jgi:DNA invertase Pin-like site-specific DNA recombinase
MQPIRTASEMPTTIIIQVNQQRVFYKTFANKANQLHALGMSYKAIAKALNISRETVRKACRSNP